LIFELFFEVGIKAPETTFAALFRFPVDLDERAMRG
jgi:hypothetical protein